MEPIISGEGAQGTWRATVPMRWWTPDPHTEPATRVSRVHARPNPELVAVLGSDHFVDLATLARTLIGEVARQRRFGLLSFYGYLVQSRVKRGETLREAQRADLYMVRNGSLLRPARVPNAQNGQLFVSASPS